jgi:hypothetical protein
VVSPMPWKPGKFRFNILCSAKNLKFKISEIYILCESE